MGQRPRVKNLSKMSWFDILIADLHYERKLDKNDKLIVEHTFRENSTKGLLSDGIPHCICSNKCPLSIYFCRPHLMPVGFRCDFPLPTTCNMELEQGFLD